MKNGVTVVIRATTLLIGAAMIATTVCAQDGGLSAAVKKHPNSLVAYTLDPNEPYLPHEAPTPSRSIVLDLDQCTASPNGDFDICKSFDVPVSGDGPPGVQKSAQFTEWLPDHKSALIHGGDIDASGRLYPFDGYVVNLESGQVSVPTGIDRPAGSDGRINLGLRPFMNGYLFAIRRDDPLHTNDVYTMRLDGTYKSLFPADRYRRTILAHACSTSPTGEEGSLAACEIYCSDAFNAIGSASRAAGTCIQVYDIGLRQPGNAYGPTPVAEVSWRPNTKKDEVGFAYMQGSDNNSPVIVVKADIFSGTQTRLGGAAVVHNQHRDFGEWSSDGKAFFFSAVGTSKLQVIGRVRIDHPDKFEPLTEEKFDAGNPALAPVGESFVCLARIDKPGLAALQLFRVTVNATGKCSSGGIGGDPSCFRRITNISDDSIISNPRWRSVTAPSH